MIKQIAITAIAATLSLSASAKSLGPATYTNPVFDLDSPDPSVVRDENGLFQCFVTNGYGRESADMVSWRDTGLKFATPTWNGNSSLWAPDATRVGDKFVYYYSLAIWGQEWVSAIGRAVADHCEGPFTDLGCLLTSAGSGVQNSIDQCLFVDDDGRCYLFWGSFSGIYAQELTPDGLYLKPGSSKVKVAGNGFEGTMLHKRDGYYYLFASTGTCCDQENSTYTTVVARSNNVLGPYLDRAGGQMLDNKCHFLLSSNRYFLGTGHNSEITTDDAGNDWIYYHAWQRDNLSAGRTLFVDRIDWIDGWPVINNGFPSYYPAEAPYIHDASADPQIEASESTLWFTISKDQTIWREIYVSSSNISSPIAVTIEGDGAQYFSTDHTSVPATGGLVRVTYTPDGAVGQHRPSLVLRAEGAETRILLRGTSNAPDDDDPVAGEIGTLRQKWIFSVNHGNLADAPWFSSASPYTRSMAVIGDNLYLLAAAPFNNSPSITIVDANSGTLKGSLSLAGLPTSGQLFCAGALGTLGNQLIMSNGVQSAAHNFCLYTWPENSGDPQLMLKISNSQLGISYGEIMGTWGDMNNGKIAFGNEEKVVVFTVADGQVSETPAVINLPEPLTTAATSPRGKFEVRFNDDGTFWHTSHWSAPTRYRIEGNDAVAIESIPESVLSSSTGTAARFFSYGSNKYAAVTAMHGKHEAGHMQLLRITDGVENATSLGTYPEIGLGTANWINTASCTQLEHQLSGRNNALAKFWVMVPGQGIAHYEYDGTSSSVQAAVADSDADSAVYYNLQGVRVSPSNLAPGLYIVRRASSVSKIIIR